MSSEVNNSDTPCAGLDEWPGQMIHQAAIYNNSELMQCLLEGDELANVNQLDSSGRTAVYTAVTNNSVDCLKWLIHYGANLNLPGGPKCHNNTPLHVAVEKGFKDIVVTLLDAGADLNALNVFNLTPVKIAELRGDVEIYSCLLREKAKRTAKWVKIADEFLLACEQGDMMRALELREKIGDRAESIISAMKYNKTLLCVCRSGEKDLVRLLLTINLEVDSISFGDKSPLHVSCEEGHLEVTLLLLEKYPENAALRCPNGRLAIHYAAMNGKLDIVSLLLEFPYPDQALMQINHTTDGIQHFHHAFDPDTLDFDSKSALYHACENGHYSVVKYMLHKEMPACKTCVKCIPEKTSDSMTQSQMFPTVHLCKPFTVNGLSPLQIAVLHNFQEIASILLETGVNTGVRADPNELTFVLKTASDYSYISLVDLLLQHGAKDDRNHILMAAEISQDIEMLGVILKYKTVPDTHCHIDRNQVKLKASELSFMSESGNIESFNSSDLDGQLYPPMTAVSLCWQDLRILTCVHTSWLISASLLHNPYLNSSHTQLSLCTITRINLQGNRILKFPSILYELSSLCYLDISHNEVDALSETNPLQIGELWPNLVKLNISHNKLLFLPSYIFHLPILFYLNASYNRLENIPEDFWFTSSLENVDFSYNNLRSFMCPAYQSRVMMSNRQRYSTTYSCNESVSSNDNSEVFTLGHSTSQELEEYSDTVLSHNLKMDVQHCVYWHSSLQVSTESDVPANDENGRKLGLKVLNLSSNHLKEIPEGLACCFPNLDQLNISENDIYNWGNLSLYPSMLRELDLSQNRLINMSSKQGSTSTSTESLFCYNTRQGSTSSWRHSGTPPFTSYIQDLNTCVHRQHRILVNLQTLNLHANRLSSLNFIHPVNTSADSCHSRNSVGTEGSFRSSATSGIGPPPVVIFPNLTMLDVSFNRINKVAGDIGLLSQLKMLNLSDNDIRELPAEMGLLKRLWKLDLENCPLEGPVHDLLAMNRPAVEITGFLNSVLEAECEYNCLNLMLVGTHNVGKTSLLLQLRKLCKIPKDSRPKHWVERIGGSGTAKGRLLSTVGIDMEKVILDKPTKGPITFRTWDFGGQREYYATHRYFLLKRSLYLVIWKISDGEEGVNGMLQWLINIQSQAPGSSVIIIGTHLDVLKNRSTRGSFPKDFEETMMKLIEERYMVPEPDKCGLPIVIDAWNVSNITGNNVKKLLQRIYDLAFELRYPKSKQTILLKQKIPKKYLYLQEIVQEIAENKKANGEDPVLTRELYKIQVMNKMMERIGTSFRDVAELDQATHFLHENGVLCHYEDINLSDTYFLDPQWLCDQLAKVVTIREVNKFAVNGVMYMKDLGLLYKSLSKSPNSGSQGYMLDLLSKFELALQFDKDKLLIPSLLPTVPCEKQVLVKLKYDESDEENPNLDFDESISIKPPENFPTKPLPQNNLVKVEMSPVLENKQENSFDTSQAKLNSYKLEPIHSMCRIYQLMYIPSGFWPQVITRLLADKCIYTTAEYLFDIDCCCDQCLPIIRKEIVKTIRWRCWQKQMELVYKNCVLLSVKEASVDSPGVICDFTRCTVLCHMGQRWEIVDLKQASVLELCFPSNEYSINFYNNISSEQQKKTSQQKCDITENEQQRTSSEQYCLFCQNVNKVCDFTLVRNEKLSCRLLARVIEHVDNLLQDWYPELGEQRFIQNIHGQYLVSRLVPCPCCLTTIHHKQQKVNNKDNWIMVNDLINQSELCLNLDNMDEDQSKDCSNKLLVNSTLHSFLVEECMLNVLEQQSADCPIHGDLGRYWVASDNQLKKLYLAPDIVNNYIIIMQMYDVKNNYVTCSVEFSQNLPAKSSAIKNLCDTKRNSTTIDHRMYNAVHAYTTARQEIAILQSLHHPQIVELLGVVIHPLALVLELAPHGSLNSLLKTYRDKQDMLPVFAVKNVILQIASALSYLHSKGIIYRDLKSENVLVWSFPIPLTVKPDFHVDVRLADYGISRMSLPTGTKGFGGTPPFIAPEILQHVGKDIYTDKVDSFSFGMFIYELVTCQQPLWKESHVNNFICQGGRPKVTPEETECPSHFLDLMTLCWSQEAKDRPSMDDIIKLASCTEFCHFMDAVSLEAAVTVLASCIFFYGSSSESCAYDNIRDIGESYTQLWLSTHLADKNMLEIYTFYRNKCVESKFVKHLSVHALCSSDQHVWGLGNKQMVYVFSPESLLCIQQIMLTVEPVCSPLDIHYLEQSKKILTIFTDGTVIACEAEVSEHSLNLEEENEAVVHTLQLPRNTTFSSTVVETRHRCLLWRGTTDCMLEVFDITDLLDWQQKHDVKAMTVGHLADEKGQSVCYLLVTWSSALTNTDYVFSYNYPGSTVVRWNVHTHLQESTLDCESAVADIKRPKKKTCLVTAMNVVAGHLYVGTTLGIIVVAEALTMVPLAILQCHGTSEFYIKAIQPLQVDTGMMEVCTPASTVGIPRSAQSSRDQRGIITVGRGFVDPFRNFLEQLKRSSVPYLESGKLPDDMYKRHAFLISWIAEDWCNY
ncbi:leucine-rich repeat serine/threonine-protein kinase 1 [Octopus bimaculoides]|nr:leucine-rich repeat serine/threonine-protein kinase 1 [Octopus bimaculoides]